MSNESNQDKLEQWITREARSLPSLRAPHTLSARVMAELQRRAVLPWWRKSFLYWPVAARMAFVALCMGLANVSVALLRWLDTERRLDVSTNLSAVMSRPMTWTERLVEVAQNTQAFFALLLRHLPATWLYGGLLTIIVLYGALLGIGATAYRALYANR